VDCSRLKYQGLVVRGRVLRSLAPPQSRADQVRQRSGYGIQIGSALAYRSIPLQSAYCACKHAINGFTDSLRCELIHDKSNVKVTVVQMPAMNTTQFGWVKNRMPDFRAGNLGRSRGRGRFIKTATTGVLGGKPHS
jgi:NAD(P)-dependent dehydrogenase (short-subunit alcohol dehydrogenase family)